MTLIKSISRIRGTNDVEGVSITGVPATFNGDVWARGGTGANDGEDGTIMFLLYVPPPQGTLILLQ